jgi:hypothetical protein
MKLIHEGVKTASKIYSKKAPNSFCTEQKLHKRNISQDRDTGSIGRLL